MIAGTIHVPALAGMHRSKAEELLFHIGLVPVVVRDQSENLPPGDLVITSNPCWIHCFEQAALSL